MQEPAAASRSQITHERCPMCGSTRWRTLIRAGDVPTPGPVIRCRDCDLAFFQRLGYDERYWARPEHAAMYEANRETLTAELKNYLPWLHEALPGRGRLLDVGCGLGEFLDLAARDGWAVEGVEPGDGAVAILRRKLEFPIHAGYFEHLPLPAAGYDCVTMWDVIEHLHDPELAIAKVAAVVKPGGCFVFKTPNERSLFKRLPLWAYRLTFRRFKAMLKYVYYDPHYYSYSLKSCRNFLARHGFQIHRVYYESTDVGWGRQKMDLSYGSDVSLGWVKRLLPVVVILAKWLRMENKMIVVARKLEGPVKHA